MLPRKPSALRGKSAAAVATVIMGLGVLAAAPSASALTPLEFEDWGTQFSPDDPLICMSSCQKWTTQTNISPTGAVDRRATITDQFGVVSAETRMGGASGCVTSMNEGCLLFNVADSSSGSLALDYRFHNQQDITNISALIANPDGSNPFAVAAFYYDQSNNVFQFADQYVIPGNTPGQRFLFEFNPHVLTNEVLLIYNPLGPNGTSFSLTAQGEVGYHIPNFIPPDGTSIGAELCCIKADVPEPDGWALMLLGFLGVGTALRGGRRLRRTWAQGSAPT